MDILTAGGLLGGLAVVGWVLGRDGAGAALLDPHGVLIVLGGTLCATLIHATRAELAAALRAAAGLARLPAMPTPETVVPLLAELCRQARRDGLRSIQDAGSRAADDGFLSRAIDVALGAGDMQTAQSSLEREINNIRSRHRETANLFRVMATLAPMFGLLGTLAGIVSVLRNLTDPAGIGPAMATAIASAFYGIALSNLVFIPLAGKLRSRSLAELLVKEVAMVGVLDIVFTQKPPTVVELGLASFLRDRRLRAGETA